VDWFNTLFPGAGEHQLRERPDEPTGDSPSLIEALIPTDTAERELAQKALAKDHAEARSRTRAVQLRAKNDYIQQRELLEHVDGCQERLKGKGKLDQAVAGWKGFAGVLGVGLAIDRGATALGADRATRTVLGALSVGTGVVAAIAMGKSQTEAGLDRLERERLQARHRKREARTTARLAKLEYKEGIGGFEGAHEPGPVSPSPNDQPGR